MDMTELPAYSDLPEWQPDPASASYAQEHAAHRLGLRNGMRAGSLFMADLLGEIEHMSRHDQLTGLLNLKGWEDLLDTLRPYIVPGKSAVVAVDLGNFKAVNDRYGHKRGDQVLKDIGERLQNITRHKDENDKDTTSRDVIIPARLGGDEMAFLVVLDLRERKLLHRGRQRKRYNAKGRMDKVVERIREVGDEYVTENPDLRAINMNLSIGSVLVGPDQTIEEALEEADGRMYADKISRLPALGWMQRIQVKLGSLLLDRAGVDPRTAEHYRVRYRRRPF